MHCYPSAPPTNHCTFCYQVSMVSPKTLAIQAYKPAATAARVLRHTSRHHLAKEVYEMVKQSFFRGRPDAVDEDIITYVRTVPGGATISAIRKAACPLERPNMIRYRVDTMAAAGMIRVERVLGRVVVSPIDGDRNTQEGVADV